MLFSFGFLVLSVQPLITGKLNSLERGMLEPTTIFHSAVSFSTNTDLQHYSGDQHFSNFSQIFFGIANFFLSASVGFCARRAIIWAFRSDSHVGNFFLDMWRVVVYLFLPIAFVYSLDLLAAGQPDDVRLRSAGCHIGTGCFGQ